MPSPLPLIMFFSAILPFMAAFFTRMIASLPSTLPEYSVSSSLDDSLPTDPDIVWPDPPQVNGISSGSDDLVQDDAAGSEVSTSGSGQQDITGSGGSAFDSGDLIAATDGEAASTDYCGDAQTNSKLRMRVPGGVCVNRQAPSQPTKNQPPVINTSLSTEELTPLSIPLLNKNPDNGCSDDKELTEKVCCTGMTEKPGWGRLHYYDVLYHCTPLTDECPAELQFCCQEYHPEANRPEGLGIICKHRN